MTTYNQMGQKIKNCIPFNGNSVYAVGNSDNYTIYSYSTEIFNWKGAGGGLMTFNNKYYSVTTSKIQNMFIRIFGLNNGKTKRDKKID